MPTIAAADRVNLDPSAKEDLQQLSDQPIDWPTQPSETEEIVAERIGQAEIALTSYNTPMTRTVFEHCPNLKYVGICGTNLINTDQEAARERGIVVRNIEDYADEATAEWVIGQLIALARGWGDFRWDAAGSTELTGKTIGLIGMGAVAQQLARRALAMDMRVRYHNRSRKPEIEALGVEFQELESLVRENQILSSHLPKNVNLLNAKHLEQMGPGSVLINTQLGVTVEPAAVAEWLAQGERFALMDGSVDRVYHETLADLPGAVLREEVAGITLDAQVRLGQKVVSAVREYFEALVS